MIFLRKTDGTAAVRLGEGYAVALSPDQKWVLALTPSDPAPLLAHSFRRRGSHGIENAGNRAHRTAGLRGR